MREALRRSAAACIVAATAGCAGDASRPTAEIVDSAGTRFVTYDLSNVTVPTYRFLSDHDLEIGERDGAPEYTFSRIADLAVAEDGRIVVSDGVAQELRVYDASGEFERTIGRQGEGPGEFATAPMITGLAGDTIFVFDSRSSRVTAFLLTGDLIAETTFRAGDSGRPQFVIRQDDGTYLSRSTWVDLGATEASYEMRLELDSIVIEHLERGGTLMDTLRVIADRSRARSVEINTEGLFRTLAMATPYSARAVMGSDGLRLIVGHSDAFQLEWIGPSTEVVTVLRVLGVQHPATAEEIRARQEAAIREAVGDREIDPRVWRANIEYLPEQLPAFENVVVGDLGDVWVSLTEYDLSEGLDWLVFTSTGELRGTVHTPPEFRLREVRNDFIVGFVLDELDVPYVRRYQLTQVRAALTADGTSGEQVAPAR